MKPDELHDSLVETMTDLAMQRDEKTGEPPQIAKLQMEAIAQVLNDRKALKALAAQIGDGDQGDEEVTEDEAKALRGILAKLQRKIDAQAVALGTK